MDLTDEISLGATVLSTGGTTIVPRQVLEVLKLKPRPDRREKILWTQEGEEIIVTKGTPQSSYKKTMLRRDGRAAVPRHIMEAMKLRSTPRREERIVWVQKRDQLVVRKGTPQLNPTK